MDDQPHDVGGEAALPAPDPLVLENESDTIDDSFYEKLKGEQLTFDS